MNISRLAIRRPVATFVVIILLLILGAVSLVKIPLQLIPDIEPPVAAVVTSYEGASPTEVLEKVTKPLEQALSTLPGLKNMTTTSSEGASLIIVEFNWSTSISDVENDIITRINQTQMPDQATQPNFLKFDPTIFPIIQLSISGDGKEISEIQDKVTELQTKLMKVEGVANIDSAGMITDEVNVVVKPEELEKYRLTQEDIVTLLRANNLSQPGGQVNTGTEQLSTRIVSELHSLEEIQDLIVAKLPITNETIKMKNIADISIQPQITTSFTRTNKKPSILLNVLQQSDSNTAAVSNAFNEELEQLKSEAGYHELQIDTLFDQGEFVQDAIKNVALSLILGGLLAMIVLFLFLRNVKSPLIVGFAIPFSVIVTFVLLYFSDATLNIMSLGGLALGIGMLVDNAIVVIENINRHLSMGKTAKEAAADGASEVAGAITASTLTTVSVFLPVVFVKGIIGNLFKELAVTISFSLIASLFVALTIIPLMASKLLRGHGTNIEIQRKKSRRFSVLEGMSKWTLKHKTLTILFFFLSLVVGTYGLTTVGTEFMPVADEGYFTINVKLQPGSSLQQTSDVVKKVEAKLEQYKEIDDYLSTIGNPGGEAAFGGTKGNHTAQIFVNMVPAGKRTLSTNQFAERIRKPIESADTKAKIKVSVQSSFSMGGGPSTLEFNLSDNDPDQLRKSVSKVNDGLERLQEVVEIKHDLAITQPEIEIIVDRSKALDHGFQPAQIAQIIGNATKGVLATQFVSENNQILAVRVAMPEETIQSVDELKLINLRKADNSYVALQDVATIAKGESAVTLSRVNQKDTVEFDVQYRTSTNLGDFTQQVEEMLRELDLPSSTEYTFTGDRELLEDSFKDLTLALALSIVFVYLVMAAQFESLKYPFVIMFSVPLVVIGSSIALTMSDTPIGVTAFIGFLVLAGIVVNNAILLVDYINRLKEQGMKEAEALVEAVKIRIRPILMTSLTTILGLIPLALGLGEGTELQQPLGITVIGGLISSTFLTLFFIPVVYSLFGRRH